MKNLQENIQSLNSNDQRQFYSKLCVVTQTYRVKDQQELFEEKKLQQEYDPYLHITCDVRLVEDGSILYGVKLTPQVLQVDDNGDVTDTILDGSEESSTGTVKVDVPAIGSYVYISWLNENDAYVSFQSNTESIVVGSANGAYIDFYIKDETRIIDLVNCDEFNVQFPRGKSFNIKTDVDTEESELITLMNTILMQAGKGKIDIKENVDILAVEDGRIRLANDTDNINKILNDLIDELISYFSTIEPILVQAGLTSVPTQNKLSLVKDQVNNLFLS